MERLIKCFKLVLLKQEKDILEIHEFINFYRKIKTIPAELIYFDIVEEINFNLILNDNNLIINLKQPQIVDIWNLINRNESLFLDNLDVFPKLLTFNGSKCILCNNTLKFRNLSTPNNAIIYDENVSLKSKIYTKECV